MFENIAAFDIGTSSIKLVTVKTGFRDFQVSSFAYEDIDFNIENAGESIREALERILKENNLKGYKILTNLPMEKGIIRNITFPFSDVEKIAEAIPYEAEENIPFKMEDLVMDFQSLKGRNAEEGRILLAATHKETIHDFNRIMTEGSVQPVRMGLESNALFECYRYFNRIGQETILQIDVGHGKTVLNIIKDNSLLYTRSISVGVGQIYMTISEMMKISYNDAVKLFENLNIDLTSFENNTQRDFYKTLQLNRARLKKIYDKTTEIVNELIEQIILTTKSFYLDFEEVEFNRMLISGGGANIMGLGALIARELDIPVVALPFLQDYDEIKIQTQFPIAFGTILSYLYKRYSAINFLKGEFLPDIASESNKIYYLSGAFFMLSVAVLFLNIITTGILKSETSRKYNSILMDRYKKYFHAQPVTDDPIKDSMKLLNDEKKELEGLDMFLSSGKVLDILLDILSFFPKEDNFELKNFVINESIVRIDGIVGSSKHIDEFKNKLLDAKRFDSVTLNTNMNKKNEISFSLAIKIRTQKDAIKEAVKGKGQ